MQSIQSIEGPGLPGTTDENVEGRQQKPKTLPCKYCSKRFRRVEHVQRHERTHTKEKPFACGWARCGKTFGRRTNKDSTQSKYAYMDIRDLLVRHEKLVHLNEGSNKDNSRPRKPSTAGAVQHISPEAHVDAEMMGMPRAHPQHYSNEPMNSVPVHSLAPDPRMPARAAACNLDLLSDAATQIASANEVNSMQPMMTDMGQPAGPMSRMKPYEDAMAYGDRGREQEANAMTVPFPGQAVPPAFDDYNLFLDEFATTSHFLPQVFETDQNFGIWPNMQRGGQSKPASQFPSRFPSVQPDPRDPADAGGRGHDDSNRTLPLRVSAMDHTVIKNRLDEFSSVLPNDFVFPSRHTLTRFLEGYVGGFHDHLPVLHLPTLTPADLSPELLLAILAVGAQHRFESHRSNALWYAAKAVALEQIRRRHSHEVHGLLPTPAAYSPHSTRPSPSHGFRHSFSSVQQDRPMTQDTHREPYSPNTPQSRLETIQALLLLFAVGLWGAKAILHEALSLQSLLAMLIREEGLLSESTQTADWEAWIRIEGMNRTKLITYCFFNLCSIAYNMPPLLLTSELNIVLPHSSKLWRAETAWQWQEARHTFPSMDISFQDAFSRLFSRPPQGPPAYLSSLGNYGLIHALIQHIFLLKQTCFTSAPYEAPRGLRPDDVEEVWQALRIWQMSFEQHQARAAETGQPMTSDSFPGGPVAYNSTALLRLASIRLFTDLSPSRTLETRDAGQIATSFGDAPYLIRSTRLNRAIMQAIHALSMLVKLGVNYVARRKSTEWSMQHSRPTDPPPSSDERNLLEMLRRMLDETEFAVPIDPSLSGGPGHPSNMDMAINDSAKLRQLAAAVIRVWAETFKGSHIFEIVKVIGNGLEGYADLIEKPRDRTPLGRLAPNTGLG
ncbi:hypothetical protein JX265_001350 [Neoarthrinium moseri]|uniref:C2H2-type domain-containing protein n=1 Tax=Neoarthrinium moseri TaxID=1658444 RepID=A0A9Q0AV37_9PEZI|nr:hypothetical protein JX265_001350 [Neoarthrinium moseri]